MTRRHRAANGRIDQVNQERVAQLSRLHNVLGSWVFSLLLWKVVDSFIAPRFGYYGYTPRETSGWEVWSCALAVGTLGATLPSRWSKPSHYARAFLTATFGIPVVVIPAFWGPSEGYTLLQLQWITVAVFAILHAATLGAHRPSGRQPTAATAFWMLTGGFVLLSIVYLFASTGMSASLVNLSDVYSQRDEYASTIGGLGAYLVGWVGAGVLPAMLVAGLYYRKRTLSAGAALGIVMLYSLTGYKSYLVGMALTLGGYFLCRAKGRWGVGWFAGLGGAIIASALLDRATDGFFFTSLLVRRALSTAGLNTSLFFDFFASNDRYELRHSILSSFDAAPYTLSPAKLIGLVYYHSDRTAANANLIADGYANFGLLGCIGMAIVLGVYLRVYDRASSHLPLQISAPALTLVLVALSNTAALTTMTTHGGFMALLLVALMPATGHLLRQDRRRVTRPGLRRSRGHETRPALEVRKRPSAPRQSKQAS